MGGNLALVQSEQDMGTKFSLILPVSVIQELEVLTLSDSIFEQEVTPKK